MPEWECQDIFQNLSNYMDGELTEAKKSKFESHVSECIRCQQFGDEFDTAIQALRESWDCESLEREDELIEKLLTA